MSVTPAAVRPRARRAAGLAAFLLAALAGLPAEASKPVRKTILGCVTGGAFVSDDGYAIRLADPSTGRPVAVGRLEGRRIGVTGDLLPGDLFRVVRPPRVLGRCR